MSTVFTRMRFFTYGACLQCVFDLSNSRADSTILIHLQIPTRPTSRHGSYILERGPWAGRQFRELVPAAHTSYVSSTYLKKILSFDSVRSHYCNAP